MMVFTLSSSFTINAFGATTDVQTVNKFEPSQITLDDLMTLDLYTSENTEISNEQGNDDIITSGNNLIKIAQHCASVISLSNGTSDDTFGPLKGLLQLYSRILHPTVMNQLRSGNILTLDEIMSLDLDMSENTDIFNEQGDCNVTTLENNLKVSQSILENSETPREIDVNKDTLNRLMTSMQITLGDIIKS